MKSSKTLFRYIFMSLVILCVSCAQLTIHDMQVCSIGPGDDPNAGAACNNIYTDAPVLLTETEWDAMAPGQYCVSAQGFSYIKQEIEDACSLVQCNYEQIQAAIARMEGLNALSLH